MGRPIKKDVLGTEVIGSYVGDPNAGIRVSFYDGSALRTDGIVIKQRGAKTFQVARVGTPLVRYSCVLQSATPSADFQMQMVGYVGGSDNTSAVPIRRITKRLVTDWSGNRYTWYLENDSSADYIVLVPVTV
jgi:hypothetical protein